MHHFKNWIRQSVRALAVRNHSTHKRSPHRYRSKLDVEPLEERTLLSATFYTPDGTGNNKTNAALGSAGTDLKRISPAAYGDGMNTPSLGSNSSARVISNILNNQTDPTNTSQDINTYDANNLSDFGYVWGQFIDHDMDLTPTGSGQSFPITAAAGDPMGTEAFTRSSFDPNTGTSTSNPRQQINAITSYLDLSQVYGSNQTVANALRLGKFGLLKTSPGNMLPFNNSTYFTVSQLAALNMANDPQMVQSTSLFATGDVRGNENLELTALQTLFVRNHNRLAAALQKLHPNWSDDQLYQEARKLNIAEEQIITYTQYLPDLLGRNALPAYKGYDSSVDPSISTEFSTVAFRFGHSLLSSNIERQGNNGQDIADANINGSSIELAQDFFDPTMLNPTGIFDTLSGHTSSDIGAVLKGDADGVSQADDLLAIRDVRNLLFGNGAFGGQDLMARDVQRARDDGIGSYNQVRVAYGLAPVTSFADITSNVTIQNELMAAYGTVDNIDPFEGGLAEDHVGGSDVGPLFQAILVDQFTRLRNGDRFFYLNENYSTEELSLLSQGNTLAKVIEANTNITNLQNDVMIFKASISGTVMQGTRNGAFGPGASGMAGVTVQLRDDSGAVISTTTTDSQGHYTFDQQTGLGGTGTYSVSVVMPAGYTQISGNGSSIVITRGDTSISGVNYVLQANQVATQLQVLTVHSAVTGAATQVTVVALDARGHPVPGYTGTISFSSSDPLAQLPANYTFTAADHGQHTFKATFQTPGNQTVTATDTATSSITGQATLTINAAGVVTHFAVVTVGFAVAGTPTSVMLVALDAANHVVTGYTGAVHFSSSDGSAALPTDYTFTAADNGKHLFSVTFNTLGPQSITATDTLTNTISGIARVRIFKR
jgi:hypothetical protein